MNWIIPNKILALSSPTQSSADGGLHPNAFIQRFKKMGIKAIIRLNESLYNENEFAKEGIKVHNLEYLDGSCPSDVRNSILTISYRTLLKGSFNILTTQTALWQFTAELVWVEPVP